MNKLKARAKAHYEKYSLFKSDPFIEETSIISGILPFEFIFYSEDFPRASIRWKVVFDRKEVAHHRCDLASRGIRTWNASVIMDG